MRERICFLLIYLFIYFRWPSQETAVMRERICFLFIFLFIYFRWPSQETAVMRERICFCTRPSCPQQWF